ncbi:MAG: TonB-dependent receptor [Bacteroidales bacterium]|nr:TonB-dependent receptor [Bacteroidales bacterium]MBN2762155.1 TonB-dependent receptor [Bacteroidales bacterium]
MKISGIILCLLLSLHVFAQEPDLLIQGNYKKIPFSFFVREAEQQTGARFFFRDEWIEDITVDAEGDSLSLRAVLSNSFRNKDLHYFIDTSKTVIITKGAALITFLPQFDDMAGIENTNALRGRNGFVTETEKTYLEGRKKRIVETLDVGSPDHRKPGKMVSVRGRITDKETGEPLIGATVFVRETGIGYATDADGQFLVTLPPGTYDVTFNCLGMEEINYYLALHSDGPLIIEMDRKLIPLDEVRITADRFHVVRGSQMGYEHITLKTIKEIPVVMGERDVLKVAQMLPGVQTMGEGTIGFNVRGSGADQNMFFINKTPVYNTSHMLGFFSAFNPDLVKDFTLYKSNIPAKYGGRLSSIFILNSPRGNKKKLTARGGISPVTGHLMVEGPLKKEKHSFILAARSTYSDWLLSQLENPELRNSKAAFYDLAGHLNFEPNEKNSIRVFGYYSHDKFSLASKNQHFEYDNRGASADWKHQWRPNLTSEIALIASEYAFQTVDSSESSSMSYKHGYSIGHYEFRTDFVWIPGQDHLVTFGLNSLLYQLDRGTVRPEGSLSTRNVVALGKEEGVETALYLSDEYEIIPGLTLSAGLRYSFYGMPGPAVVYDYFSGSPRSDLYVADTIRYSGKDLVAFYSGPELRGALNIRTGENSSVKLSYNKTRQYLFMLSNTLAVSPTDQWKLCDYHIRPPHTNQVSVGFYKDFEKKDINFSTEVYYKKTKDIIEYKDGASFISEEPIETQLLQGEQQAYGVEFMLRKNTGRLSGWLSYSYSSSTMLVDGPNSWDRINNGLAYPSNYDKPHAVNAVFNYRFSRQLSIGSNIVYNTGRPVTYPVAVYYINNREHMFYSLRNEYRIPDYFRMDLSINIEGNLKARKLAHSSWMLNVYNLTGRKNAYSVFFEAQGQKIESYKMSIFGMPIFTITWNFKFGNYASD